MILLYKVQGCGINACTPLFNVYASSGSEIITYFYLHYIMVILLCDN